jgi:hypothetical protein
MAAPRFSFMLSSGALRPSFDVSKPYRSWSASTAARTDLPAWPRSDSKLVIQSRPCNASARLPLGVSAEIQACNCCTVTKWFRRYAARLAKAMRAQAFCVFTAAAAGEGLRRLTVRTECPGRQLRCCSRMSSISDKVLLIRPCLKVKDSLSGELSISRRLTARSLRSVT